MGQISDESGNIITRQGDTFYIKLEQIDPEVGGTLFAQVVDENRTPMFPTDAEPSVDIYGLTEAEIEIPKNYSDLLTVPPEEDFKEYKYAVKHCTSDEKEDTWFLGGSEDFGKLPKITVYPKIVEGGTGAAVPTTQEG